MREHFLHSALLLLAGMACPRATCADGNVTAFVDGAGDLWLIGDAQDNSLHIRDETGVDGEFVIGDDSGTTTVNGAVSMTVVASGSRIVISLAAGNDRFLFGRGDYACCNRRVLFSGGGGNDRFELDDKNSVLDDLDVDLGPGDDVFLAGEGAFIGQLLLTCGDGGDVVRVGPYTGLGGSARIDLGAGANELEWLDTSVAGAVTILGGADAETFLLEELSADGFVRLTTGGGNDRLEIGTVSPLFHAAVDGVEPLFLDTGEGDDHVLVRGACELPSALIVQTGNGRDSVELAGAFVRGRCAVLLGTGDDRLHVEDSLLGQRGPRLGTAAGRHDGPVLFDGGAGIDLYLLGAGNSFPRGGPTLRGFDLPKVAEAGRLEFAARIVGRVVLADAHPVPHASVAIAEFGLTTSADDEGRFACELPATPGGRLEVTAGATVDGQRLCGAAQVRAIPSAVVDLGDLVLGSGCSNTLLFGDGQGEAAILADNLRAIGLAPAEIQRERFLPEDLSTFAVVWHVAVDFPLTQAEQGRLAAFVGSGGGLHLAGEGAAITAAHETLVNALVLGGGVQVGVPQGSSPWFPLVYARDAAGGIGMMPNALTAVMDFVTGGKALEGVDSPNAFILGASGQVFAAVWSGQALAGGSGRLSLGLSTLWFRATGNLPAIENLQAFLSRQQPGPSARGATW